MTTSEKLDLFEKFDEGTELTDGVQFLIHGVSILNGISCDDEVSIILVLIEKLIREYCEMARGREFSWEEYNEIDSELYKYVLGGATKLTEEEYGV